jgi:peptide/nickel transport system substrate-binding protein/oligopeptide transport system substrate-binding protein
LRAALSPIPPERRGLPAQDGFARSVRGLALEVEPMAQAVQRFNDGAVDVALGGTVDTLPLTTSNGLSRGNVQFDPVIGLYGLIVENADGFLSDPARREALALAIDRDGLVNAMGVGGWRATTRLVAPEVADDRGWWASAGPAPRSTSAGPLRASGFRPGAPPDLRRGQRAGPASGRARWARFASGGGAASGPISPPSGSRSNGWARGAGRLAPLRQGGPLCARELVSRPVRLLGDTRDMQRGRRCSGGAGAGMHDPRARADLLAQAERAVTQANGFIPIARPVRWSLVRSGVTGFSPTHGGGTAFPPQITK